jgi:hypothetical protein
MPVADNRENYYLKYSSFLARPDVDVWTGSGVVPVVGQREVFPVCPFHHARPFQSQKKVARNLDRGGQVDEARPGDLERVTPRKGDVLV